MKKVLLSAVAILGLTFANAQEKENAGYKPVKGTITTEVGLVGGLNNANFALNTGMLKFRYFFKDDMAFRLGLGINSNKEVTEDNSNPSNVATETHKYSNTSFNFGVEKHFAGSDRLSTYAGADLVVGFRGAKSTYEENGYSYEVDGATDYSFSNNFSNRAGFDFGFKMFTGADYYIAKKVYLGVEAGLGFTTGKDKDVTVSETGNADVDFLGGKSGGIATSVFGGVRIGYQF